MGSGGFLVPFRQIAKLQNLHACCVLPVQVLIHVSYSSTYTCTGSMQNNQQRTRVWIYVLQVRSFHVAWTASMLPPYHMQYLSVRKVHFLFFVLVCFFSFPFWFAEPGGGSNCISVGRFFGPELVDHPAEFVPPGSHLQRYFSPSAASRNRL